jgi:hypothetical protein
VFSQGTFNFSWNIWIIFAQESKFTSVQNGGRSRDSAVSVATTYGFDDPGVKFRVRVR